MRIATTLDHTPNGRPVIRATGGGRTKTTNYDHGLSHNVNHGHAAANLILAKRDAMGITATIPQIVAHIDAGKATHETVNGAKHVFVL